MRPEHMCPECFGPTDRMPILSALGVVDFFLCRACRKVSTESKEVRSAVPSPPPGEPETSREIR